MTSINLGPCGVAGEVERQRTLIIMPHGERPKVTEHEAEKSNVQREKEKQEQMERVRRMDFF